MVGAEDFENFGHGPIEEPSFVFLYSGHAEFSKSDKGRYTQYPACLHESAIQWLVENAQNMLGFCLEDLAAEYNEGDVKNM